MKVFTVGMDQKPPIEKSPETPPPSYTMPPLPMGPELAQPIIVRKSRGYKGIMLVMLGVFLMAVFALVLNEMAYNRQRDENFFRLQWAQMRHRMGYPREFGEQIVPEVHGPQMLQRKPETTTPSVREDKFLVDNELDSSVEQKEPERDVRLQFLKSILQKIKQNAEDMGLQGTMQVSVVEVEPQQLPSFLNKLKQQENEKKYGPSADPNSDAFLDSFGEFHAPNPFNGQPMHPKPFAWSNDEPIFHPEPEMFRPPPIPEWALQRPELEPEFRHEFGKSSEVNPQEVMGEMYGRRFGRILQDLIAARLQNRLIQAQQQEAIMNRPSFPIEPQQSWWEPAQQVAEQPKVEVPQWPHPQFQQFQSNHILEQQPQGFQPAQGFQPQQPQEFMKPQDFLTQPQQPQGFQAFAGQEQPQGFVSQPQQPRGFEHLPQFNVEQQVQQQAQQAQQVLQPERPVQPPRTQSSQDQTNSSHSLASSFLFFFPSEERAPQWQQEQHAGPQPVFENKPAPAGWTHQAESEPASKVVDGEVEKKDQHLPHVLVLPKPAPVDAQPLHEDSASSQLADLPFKELQGELAAAAAALAQQQEAIERDAETQAFLQAKEDSTEVKDNEDDRKVEDVQRPVEPAAIQSEQQNEEPVDFPAVKFPHEPLAFEPHADAEPHIFFQVDEPQPSIGAGHV
ncbi:unnamed protein product [Bursaphelenchus okinawaensis]|uniref:Uncharacterized protein n=1 Tax=Bursaphelenchus okinawaensis TaxID=465554 RepID=A0A811K001_9BILA|nr:unnamed protein product [Bursaphelenchus okinawaensis]CAG9088714.1 unnamed protein product [Bursaphelenchus okinawaensis]